MISWKNLDELESYKKLSGLKNEVNIAEAMTGANGAERVNKYSVPMSSGLTYNFAAKAVDDTVLSALSELQQQNTKIKKYGK